MRKLSFDKYILTLIILNFVDIPITVYNLSHGGKEDNPLVRYLLSLDYGIYYWILLKLVLALFIIFGMYLLQNSLEERSYKIISLVIIVLFALVLLKTGKII